VGLVPVAARHEDVRAELVSLDARGLTTPARLALVRLAQQSGDRPRLESAARDTHPFVRACALEALAASGALSEELRRAASRSDDPWLRAAVLDPAAAVAALDSDPDPQLRRAAIELIVRQARRSLSASLVTRAADSGARSGDPYLRARSALLLREWDDHRLRLLLELSRDPEPMVRVAADEVLESHDELPGQLRALLRRDLSAPQRIAAWGYLVRERTALVAGELAAALADAALDPCVAEQLRALTLVLPEGALASTPGLAAHVPVAAPGAPALEPARARRPPLAPPAGAARRPLGRSGVAVSPLGLSGAYQLPVPALVDAVAAGVNLFFWEPHYLSLTRFLREQRRLRQELVVVAGSFHGSEAAIRHDVETALRRLHTDRLDLFLLFWARSRERLSDELNGVLRELKREGKIRAAGFSTHHRELAAEAIGRTSQVWDAIMIRHSAAHTGAEAELFPRAQAAGVGVITFSALCYGRLLQQTAEGGRPPSAADCYRYSLSQSGVTACLSAPRRQRELDENLAVLAQPMLPFDAMAGLRAFGAVVRQENLRFNTLVRQAGRAAVSSNELAELEPPPAASEGEPAGASGEWPAEPAGPALWRDSSSGAPPPGVS
jgi:aryl-alcohol dehydrogenase-like predicted oxidoreductase